jgi:hypothetical protein
MVYDHCHLLVMRCPLVVARVARCRGGHDAVAVPESLIPREHHVLVTAPSVPDGEDVSRPLPPPPHRTVMGPPPLVLMHECVFPPPPPHTHLQPDEWKRIKPGVFVKQAFPALRPTGRQQALVSGSWPLALLGV